MFYRHFDTAAETIGFAVEALDVAALQQASLEGAEERFERSEIRRLYDAADYPLSRNNAAA